jgi:hypothetical protein
VPKSRVRKKKDAVYTPPTRVQPKKRPPSPRWVGWIVLSLLGLGIAWLVVAYITGGEAPVQEKLGNWNVAVGFGFIASGFALATQWR